MNASVLETEIFGSECGEKLIWRKSYFEHGPERSQKTWTVCVNDVISTTETDIYGYSSEIL